MRKSGPLMWGPLGAILIAAMVTGCSRLPEQPSRSPQSPATSPGQTPMATSVVAPSSTAQPPVSDDLDPVDGTDLPIAGRDGAPGAISCNGLGRFTYEWLHAQPTGAETLPGPEFDVLRETIALYGDDPEFAFDGLTFREGHRDAAMVVFLGDLGHPDGPFAHIDVEFEGGAWKWAGMSGGCFLVGEPGDGWGGANWVLDPSFDRPTPKTRKLHLLVSEVDCNPSVPIVGRLSPAFVFFERSRVRIQMFIRTVEPLGSCEGLKPMALGPPVAVSLTLPEPLGARELKDSTPGPCRGCGG